MTDLYFTENGDIRISPHGDLALTNSVYRHLGQQAHIRIMTDTGDYTLYPRLGSSLSKLYGMPQSQATGEYGVSLIKEALSREGIFAGQNVSVKAFPTGPQSIRFDVYILTAGGTHMVLSIERNLTTQELTDAT